MMRPIRLIEANGSRGERRGRALLHEDIEHGSHANREDDRDGTRDDEGPHCHLLGRFLATSTSDGALQLRSWRPVATKRCVRTSGCLSLADSGRGGSLGNYSCSTRRPASDGHHLTQAEHYPSLSPQPGCRNLQAAAHVCPETPSRVHVRGASFAELKDGQRELQAYGRVHQRLCGRQTRR